MQGGVALPSKCRTLLIIDKIRTTMKTSNNKLGYALCILLCAVFTISCKQETYKTTEQICVRGHYEKRAYETGGRSVSTMSGTSNRIDTMRVWVCDEYKTDTVECVRWVFK